MYIFDPLSKECFLRSKAAREIKHALFECFHAWTILIHIDAILTLISLTDSLVTQYFRCPPPPSLCLVFFLHWKSINHNRSIWCGLVICLYHLHSYYCCISVVVKTEEKTNRIYINDGLLSTKTRKKSNDNDLFLSTESISYGAVLI